MMLADLMAIVENVTAQNAERDLRKNSDFSRFFEKSAQRDLRFGGRGIIFRNMQIRISIRVQKTKGGDFCFFSPSWSWKVSGGAEAFVAHPEPSVVPK